MFRIEHNVASTPPKSFSGEVRDRTIWGYWAQGYEAMPELMKLCVATWQRFNPKWDVRILSRSSVHKYLSEVELPNKFMHILSHQTASDCVRLALLSRYGGVWIDVSIILLVDLDEFCWDAVSSGRRDATVFYHPRYGTDALGGKDLVESWFLATLPGNPFFVQWRDLLRELMHNRLDVDGVLGHPLYQGIDLSGIHRLNQEFDAGFDFREYLAIHAMCHRVLETNERAREQWCERFQRIDAVYTAFRLQIQAEATSKAAWEVLLSDSQDAEHRLGVVPLIKLRTPDYGPLLSLSREQLLGPPLPRTSSSSRQALLGRLLTRAPPSPWKPPTAGPVSRANSSVSAMVVGAAGRPAIARGHATGLLAALMAKGSWLPLSCSLVEQESTPCPARLSPDTANIAAAAVFGLLAGGCGVTFAMLGFRYSSITVGKRNVGNRLKKTFG